MEISGIGTYKRSFGYSSKEIITTERPDGTAECPRFLREGDKNRV
jgi:hypothetical protein